MKETTVLIVDDHQLIREAWKCSINADSRFHVIAETGNGKDALQLAIELRPDIVLMDINMPEMDGIDATQLIKQNVPHVKIVGVSSHTHSNFARRIIKMGACGYVTKNSSRNELLFAMTEALSGKNYICQDIKDSLANQTFNHAGVNNGFEALTDREIEIGNLVRKGNSSKEIADELCISTRTVEVHRSNIFKKLNIKNSSALANYFHKYILNRF